MTVNQLQEMLINEIQSVTSELNLTDALKESKKLKGYMQAIPLLPMFGEEFSDNQIEEVAEKKMFPYFVVRLAQVRYHKRETEESQAEIVIIFGIYDDNSEMKGYYSLLSIIEKVIMRFQTNPVLGPFYCERSIEAAFQEDDTFPYFFGGIEMVWNLPDLEMEELR